MSFNLTIAPTYKAANRSVAVILFRMLVSELVSSAHCAAREPRKAHCAAREPRKLIKG
jgi:hypothetical protein